MKEVIIKSKIVGKEGAIGGGKPIAFPDLSAYALRSDFIRLESSFNDFLEGDDTDNVINRWKELEAFLNNISEDYNLLSLLNGKADKATTLSGYGITDAYTKTNVDDLLKSYVTLGGTQTITGEKNFTGGLKVNGSPIYYNTEKKYWKLEGDLLVTGGVTMYGSDSSFTPSTIMDAIAVDGTTISKSGGVLKVIGGTGGGVADSVAWANITGKPSWIGSSKPSYSYSEITGAISTTEMQNYLTSNSYLNVTEGDNRYLQLSGGTISGTYGALTIHRTNEKSALIKYSNTSGDLGYLGFNSSKEPFVYKGTDTTTSYKIWYSGNDGSGSGLDADKLDGVQLDELFTSLSSGSTNKLSITIGGVTKSLETLYASYTDRFRVVWNNPTSGTYELNDFLGGYVRHYGSGGSLSNAPSNFGNGAVLALTNGTKGLSGQLAWNIVHNSTSNVTNKLWWRAADSANGFTYSQWKQIAFTESNVASATKLETARTIWGQNFDGTGNVSGTIYVTNSDATTTVEDSGKIKFNSLNTRDDYRSPYIQAIHQGNYSRKRLSIFQSNATNYTDDFVEAFTILPNGNVGIGTTSPSYKLHVIGDVGNENVRLRYSTSNPFLSLVRSTSSETWYVQAVSGYLAIGSTSSASCKIDASGNFLSPAGITMYSDQRKKTILNHVELSLKDIANAPLIEHYYNIDENKTTHVGSIAQYWASMNDWFCKLDSEGYYTMEIQNAALASAISIARELDRYESKTDKDIKKLKKRICELEEEVERLKSA